MNLAPELQQTLRQEPVTRQEHTLLQCVGLYAHSCYQARRTKRRILLYGELLKRQHCQQRYLRRQMGVPEFHRRRKDAPSEICRIATTQSRKVLVTALLTFVAFLVFAQSPIVKSARELAAAVVPPAPQPVMVTLEWSGAVGETNTFDFAGYVVSWSTNVDMNNATTVFLPPIWSHRFTNLPNASTFYFAVSSYGTKDSKGMDRGIQIKPPAKLTWNRTEPELKQVWIWVEGGTNSAKGPFYGVSDLPQLVITNLNLFPYEIFRAKIEYK